MIRMQQCDSPIPMSHTTVVLHSFYSFTYIVSTYKCTIQLVFKIIHCCYFNTNQLFNVIRLDFLSVNLPVSQGQFKRHRQRQPTSTKIINIRKILTQTMRNVITSVSHFIIVCFPAKTYNFLKKICLTHNYLIVVYLPKVFSIRPNKNNSFSGHNEFEKVVTNENWPLLGRKFRMGTGLNPNLPNFSLDRYLIRIEV